MDGVLTSEVGRIIVGLVAAALLMAILSVALMCLGDQVVDVLGGM